MAYENIEQLKESVTELEITVVTLQDLRDMTGYSRLGKRVLWEIGHELTNNGLGYFPAATIDDNDSPRQWDAVRIYKKDSSVGKVIEAVQSPTAENDTFLKEVASGENANAADILDKIRTLLED